MRIALLAGWLLLTAANLSLAQEGRAPSGSPKADQVPAAVDVSVYLVQWSDEAAKALPDDFTGATNDVMAKIAALEKDGKLQVAQSFRLNTIDGGTATANIGEQRPSVTSIAGRGRGGIAGETTSVSYMSTGTLVEVKPMVFDNVAVLSLSVERSGAAPRDNAPTLGESSGEKIKAETHTQLRVKNSVRLNSGEAAILGGFTTGKERQVIVVSAKITK